MRFSRKAIACALLGVLLLFPEAEYARAEEPAPGREPSAAPGAAGPSTPAAETGAPASAKARPAKKAKKARKGRKGRKAGKRSAKKKRAPRKRSGGKKGRGAAPAADERGVPGAEARNDAVPEAPPVPAAAEPRPSETPEAPVVATGVGENGDPAPTGRERLVAAAETLLDIPYRFGGSSLLGVDCSGYVQKVFGFFGLTLPRTAREMFGLGTEVSREELSLGDLVFFRTYASFPSHVGIYIGNNMFIHASSRDRKVKVDSLDAPYYLRKYIGGKRLPIETGTPGS